MDLGHPAFMHGSFAFDSRLGDWLFGLSGRRHSYATTSKHWTESKLTAIAESCSLTSWRVDRLIFNFAKIKP